jgi:serine/threonine protein kinase
MQLMKRRLEVNNASALFSGSSGASGSHSARIPAAPSVQSPQGVDAGAAGDGFGADSVPGTSANRSGSDGGPALQLQHVIGTGSFGSVYLANWRGKQVAVKVMHLPADALVEPLDEQQANEEDEEDSSSTDVAADSMQGELRLQQQQQRRRQQWQRQQNSPPHMAIMEAVVSSTMNHPNVIRWLLSCRVTAA